MLTTEKQPKGFPRDSLTSVQGQGRKQVCDAENLQFLKYLTLLRSTGILLVYLYNFRIRKSVADPGFSRGGAWTLQGGREHAKFSRKLHEIERIWTPRGGRASLTPPPLDPPMANENLSADFVLMLRNTVKKQI